MFWVRYGYNKGLRSKKQKEAPKGSRFQHIKISSSDCPIVPRFEFCSHFWKWKPPWEKNQKYLIIFLPSNVSIQVKFFKICTCNSLIGSVQTHTFPLYSSYTYSRWSKSSLYYSVSCKKSSGIEQSYEIKSPPFGPFCVSEFWGFSLLKI